MHRYKNIKVLLFLILIFNTNLSAQSVKDSILQNENTSISSDIGIFFKTGINIYSSPAKFDTKDWIITGSVLTATGLAFFIDDDVRSFWQRNQSNTTSDILKVGEIYGNSLFVAGIAGSVYLGGKIFGDPEFATTGRMLMEGLFYSGLTTLILKFVTGRNRPYTNSGPYFFKAFQTNDPNISFPSGHVTMAFAFSSILSERIDNIYASIALYTLSTTTFLQRMYSDNHWLSDAILGAAIGYFTGKAAIYFDKKESGRKLSILPYYDQKDLGLRLVLPM